MDNSDPNNENVSQKEATDSLNQNVDPSSSLPSISNTNSEKNIKNSSTEDASGLKTTSPEAEKQTLNSNPEENTNFPKSQNTETESRTSSQSQVGQYSPPVTPVTTSPEVLNQNSAAPNEGITPQVADQSINPTTVTTSSKESTKRPPVLVGILVVITILVYVAVAYLYYQNNTLKNQTSETDSTKEVVTKTPEPIVTFNPDYIQIVNGSIHNTNPNSEEISVVLVDKNEYLEDTGIVGFAKVSVSPDSKNICFESIPPAPSPGVYIAGIDGENVTKISLSKDNCLWNADSTTVYYNGIASTKSEAIDIYKYEISESTETNVTNPSNTDSTATKSAEKKEESRFYRVTSVSPDGKTLDCSYTTVVSSTAEKYLCSINLDTLEIVELGVDNVTAS